jgi:hypothetical protein
MFHFRFAGSSCNVAVHGYGLLGGFAPGKFGGGSGEQPQVNRARIDHVIRIGREKQQVVVLFSAASEASPSQREQTKNF